MADRWVLITQQKCSPCTEAKAMLWERDIPYAEFDIAEHPSLKSFLVNSFDKPTTPQVFVNGHLIGGRDELREYFRALELCERF